jgi:DNA-binding XRE family transcriptional regulator
MSQRQSLALSPPPCLIDLAALGDRLRRWRLWRGYSQAALARLAGVDPMVIGRLEGQQKPRLEVETAAKLARVCGWSLDQLCGWAPVSTIPAPTPGYTPLTEGMPRRGSREGCPPVRKTAS